MQTNGLMKANNNLNIRIISELSSIVVGINVVAVGVFVDFVVFVVVVDISIVFVVVVGL